MHEFHAPDRDDNGGSPLLGSAFANAEEIALSLVHPKGRVDIPVSAVRRLDDSATIAFRNTETGEVHEYPHSSRRGMLREGR